MFKPCWDAIWINGSIVTCEEGYGLIPHGGLAIKDGLIAWIGTMEEIPGDIEKLATHIYDLNGRCLTPGLIDCHTHLIFGGNRANEFEMRLQGVSYEEIARNGGGIQSTVTATRAASEEELLTQAIKRASALIAEGVTTVEIKSGYGLDWNTEYKMLTVAKRIGEILPLTVQRTFLGAHTIPREFKQNPEDYVNLVCDEMIPRVAEQKLADAVDVFCEKIAFSLPQTEKIFKAATQHGLAIKCHAEQLSDSGSAKLAAKYHALSVDHLEHLSLESIKAIAESKTTAVLLPGAFYYLRETHLPPVTLLREHNIPIAIATDCNPGTSPILSLRLILNMACTLFRFTPEEALLGVTKHAAMALGIEKMVGTLKIGKFADLAVWDIKHPAELSYYIGGNLLHQLVKNGREIAFRSHILLNK